MLKTLDSEANLGRQVMMLSDGCKESHAALAGCMCDSTAQHRTEPHMLCQVSQGASKLYQTVASQKHHGNEARGHHSERGKRTMKRPLNATYLVRGTVSVTELAQGSMRGSHPIIPLLYTSTCSFTAQVLDSCWVSGSPESSRARFDTAASTIGSSVSYLSLLSRSAMLSACRLQRVLSRASYISGLCGCSVGRSMGQKVTDCDTCVVTTEEQDCHSRDEKSWEGCMQG